MIVSYFHATLPNAQMALFMVNSLYHESDVLSSCEFAMLQLQTRVSKIVVSLLVFEQGIVYSCNNRIV